MNLAEIRRKAQKGETAESIPSTSFVSRQAPEPLPPEEVERAAAEAPLHAVVAEPRPEERGDLVLPEFWEDEAVRFDPAAVILKGRETSTLGEELPVLEERTAEALELLCFKVASEEYALSIMDIKEIIKPREVTEVPRVPSFVRGILSLRGIIIPIFDMRLRLGLPGSAASEKERIVVVKRETGFCGILVDEVVQVVRVPSGGIEPPPVVLEGIDRDFVQGIGRVGGRMLILLDMEKVLDVNLF